MKRKYHYEWAAYTDNLWHGRQFICRSPVLEWVRARASESGLGCFRIKRERVYEEE